MGRKGFYLCKHSLTMKWTIALGSIVVGALLLWWAGVFGGMPSTAPAQSGQQQTTTQSGTPTASNDTSDAALQQDSAAVDAQMNGLQNDSAGVNSSVDSSASAQ